RLDPKARPVRELRRKQPADEGRVGVHLVRVHLLSGQVWICCASDGRAQPLMMLCGNAKTQSYSVGSTIVSEFPPGSRSLNIGGTGSPQRATSASTSTPAALSVAWSASMSLVERMMPVSTAVGPPSIGGVIAIDVELPAGTT